MWSSPMVASRSAASYTASSWLSSPEGFGSARSSVTVDAMIAGEPLDLLVNNTVVAQGEIVLVNERYGIRLTRVAPASERMKNL